jgi:glycolate oxidase iron-sulfur subunit
MQTKITSDILATAAGQEADRILRACVHCGFCTATCPTYQLLGDELDGPRGRIYQIKEMLEGAAPTRKTQLHIDRCLTCRSCETTCPSGVQYGRLVDIGRGMLEAEVPRPPAEKLMRRLLRMFIPYPERMRGALFLASPLAKLLPGSLRRKVPPVKKANRLRDTRHERRMLVLDGCIQSVSTPQTNDALARILDKLGVSLVSADRAGCCGGMSYHLGAHDEGLDFMRRNIDAWWPEVDNGVEAIIVSASGCGVTVKEYGHLLAQDKDYADKARRISELARDPVEVLDQQNLASLGRPGAGRRIAFHSPCTLQHGQAITGRVESILAGAGYELTPVENAHLCCGSAGTYSVLQAELSQRLLADKVEALKSGGPELIATANIGCQMHIATAAGIPVVHWLELLDQ